MTEYGKHGKPWCRLPTLPTLFGNPFGIPHSHGLGDRLYVFSCPPHTNHSARKGLVTDVSGPQRNACPGTLTHQELCYHFSIHQGRRCGRERDSYENSFLFSIHHFREADLPLPTIMMSTPIQGGVGAGSGRLQWKCKISEWLERGARPIHLPHSKQRILARFRLRIA